MSVDGIFASSYVPYIYPTAKPVGSGEEFVVGPSPLRTESASQSQAAATAAAIDPADALRFSRDFPQILMQQAFAAPIAETRAPSPTESTGTAGMNYLWQGDAARSGLEPGDIGSVEEMGEGRLTGEDEEEAAAEEAGQQTNARGEPMSEEEQSQVQDLKNRDREVRAHEQAHQAAGGQYAGGASYEYEQGPDGQRYAVGGEVSIDVSSESDPQATIAKMQQVRAAALAPADPSSQDRSVAAAAQQAELQARGELTEEQATEGEEAADEVNGETDENGETEAASETGENNAVPGAPATAADARIGGEDGDDAIGDVAGTGTGMGMSTLRNPAFENAYNNQASAMQSTFSAHMMTDPVLASTMAYRPIDIVA